MAKKKETIKGKLPRVKPRATPMPTQPHKSKKQRIKHKKKSIDELTEYNVFI